MLAQIGSVSHATMREEDLIPRFLDLLKSLDTDNRHAGDIEEIEARMSADDYYGSDDAAIDLNETLWDALQEFAPAYCYFGSHCGDGSDYGFWVDWDSIEHESDDIYRVSGLDEIPDDCQCAYILETNDHGNATLWAYHPASKRVLAEVWAIV